ncbi:hypothetical protein FACS189413_16170 [Bacteroidia bacterium]|nr:hypothetical protein FACS189413_16170 [Bacteroidia bacterium]
MFISDFSDKRELKTESKHFDLIVVGGGMSGVCCAITAARQGVSVALIQDRPVLGGNASSEVRVWVLGATSHMGNNNRWSREGGVIDEILVENLHRNKEGNPLLFDMVLIDKVQSEKNISLFLNTVVYDIAKSSPERISKVYAFNPQNGTKYEFLGDYFADCSGDGTVACLSGASYRIGAEEKEVYGELFAPDKEYGKLLGHSILFYTKDTGKPVKYIAPGFAIKTDEIETLIPKLNNPHYFNVKQHGCKYWWLEYGGRLDTIHDTETIKYELWKIVYGVWGYIKNSGKFPDMETQTLEWVGLMPGKRESRRFIGHYTLTQSDVIEQRTHYDAVAYGGWSIDTHPADAVYSPQNGCNQWHSKGIFQIPYRCMVSKDLDNLYVGGRTMSASHIAHASTRVMCTSAHTGQAIGMAAALCAKNKTLPSFYIQPENIGELQQALINSGQYIPNTDLADTGNLLYKSKIAVSSVLKLDEIPFDNDWRRLDYSSAQLLPFEGNIPEITLEINAGEDTELVCRLSTSSKDFNFTPDVILEEIKLVLPKGTSTPTLKFKENCNGYGFICLMQNEKIRVRSSKMLLTGTVSVFNYINPAVSNFGKQTPPAGIGIEEFEFWCPRRRPDGANFAMRFGQPLECFNATNLLNAYYRPVKKTNAWAADLKDDKPSLTLNFDSLETIKEVVLFLDTDYDHAMENVQMGHYDNDMPLVVHNIKIYANDKLVKEISGNYQTVCAIRFEEEIRTDKLTIEVQHPSAHTPAAIFGLIVK